MNPIRKILSAIGFIPKNTPPAPPEVQPRRWLPPNVIEEIKTIRIAEVKAGDTVVVSLPRIEIYGGQAEIEKIEQSIKDEMKMPEGVTVVVFLGQVEIFHLRKI